MKIRFTTLRTRAAAVKVALGVVTVALVLGACSTTAPRSTALDDARSAVDNARAAPAVVTYAGAELGDAVSTYQRAEALYGKEGDTAAVRNLSYLAKQRAATARETAELREAEQKANLAKIERAQLAARAAEADAANRDAKLADLRAEAARSAARDTETEAARRQAIVARQNAEYAQQRARSAQSRTEQLETELRELYAARSDRGLVITMNDVLFDTASANLRPGGMRLVARIATFLREYPARAIAIEGFTDSVGDDAYNQALSARRADAVRAALMDAGIPSSRIVARGYGEAFPVASNDTADGRQRNRRVEIVIGDGEVALRVASARAPR